MLLAVRLRENIMNAVENLDAIFFIEELGKTLPSMRDVIQMKGVDVGLIRNYLSLG
jgi:hypothetical protein